MSDREKRQLGAELQILAALKHPNIIEYFHRSHLRERDELHMYMEYCGNGDLGGYIKKLRSGPVPSYADEGFVWAIFAQLVGALFRCHTGEDPPRPGDEVRAQNASAGVIKSKQGRYQVILHRDLKPENSESTISLRFFPPAAD